MRSVGACAEDLLHVGDAPDDTGAALVEHHRGALVGSSYPRSAASAPAQPPAGNRRSGTPSAKPDTDRAATAAHGGQRHHRMPRGAPARPGGRPVDTAGVPASVISATWPAASATITPAASCSLCWCAASMRMRIPCIEQALAVARILGRDPSTAASTASARSVMSAQVPERRRHHIQ